MTTASVEFGIAAQRDGLPEPLHGRALSQELIDWSGGAATSGACPSYIENFEMILRFTPDADCYMAVGTTPDTTATAATKATSARRLVRANNLFEQVVRPGDKVAANVVA
jgi:hypothetical protein